MKHLHCLKYQHTDNKGMKVDRIKIMNNKNYNFILNWIKNFKIPKY